MASDLCDRSFRDKPVATSGAGRLLSLDVFRGLTILAMILVNNPGGGEGYWPLEHADWHGWTPTDLIFPFFLFIVGTSLAYSLRRFRDGAAIRPAVYWRIARRTALLIFLGWMPSLLLKTINYAQTGTFDLSTLRIFGVLVRIALVYFFTSLIVLHVPLRGQIVLGAVLLLGYWGLLAWLPNPHDYHANLSHEGNVVGAVDRALIGEKHMYSGDPITDPEGLLSTLPAIITALLGYWTGLAIQRRGLNYETVILLAGCGAICVEIGLLWNLSFPINKKIWTSSYVLLSGGLAMQLLAGCILKFDIWGWRRLARPYEIVGINAIFVFVGSGLLATALNRAHVATPPIETQIMQTLWDSKETLTRSQIVERLSSYNYGESDLTSALRRLTERKWLVNRPGSGIDFYTARIKPKDAHISLHRWLYETLWTSWVRDLKLASLSMALTTVAFWWFVCWIMSRLGWAIRV